MRPGKFNIISGYTTVVVFFVYLTGGLCFGEIHPFSQYPMYSTFPNWAYVFYVTDQHDSLLPAQTLGVSSNQLGHMYYGICKKNGISVGDGKETTQELNRAGDEMLFLIAERNKEQFPLHKTLKLKRKFLSLNADSTVNCIITTLGEKHW